MSVVINGTTGISGVDGTAAAPAVQGNDTNTGIFFPANDTIAFAEGGTEVMRIDANGNVGIGTSPIVDRLVVKSNTNINFGVGSNVAVSGALCLQAYNDIRTVNVPIELRGSAIYFTTPSTGSTSFTIDASGRSTNPNQPVFSGYRSAGEVTSGNIFITNVAEINVGSCYNTSTGLFTAPVSGNYFIGFFGLSNDSSAAAFRVNRNGSPLAGFWPYQNSTSGNGSNPCGMGIVPLSTNDTLSLHVATGNIIGSTNFHNRLTIYLVS